MSEVSVVVLNWNGGDKLIACLESLFLQKISKPEGAEGAEGHGGFEVILVDNASDDGSLERVRKRYGDRVRIIENKSNLGFAVGCNQGISASQSPWIALINNDAVADPRWLLELLRKGKGRPDVGMVATRILRHDNRDLLDSIGVGLYPDGMSRALHRGEKDSARFRDGYPVLIPSGAACLLRREMLNAQGCFPEDFFIYSDDTDLAIRGQLAGWKCVFAPKAVVYHHYSAAVGPASRMKIFYVERNRIWVLLKFYPLSMILISGVYTLIRYLAVIYYLFRTPRDHAGRPGPGILDASFALISAYLSAIRGISRQWMNRKKFGPGATNSYELWRKWLKDFRLDLKTISGLD